MESFGDKARAFGLALGLHIAVFGALLLGLWWTHESRPVVMPGPVIEATLVGPTAAPKAGARRPAPPKPAPPKPEPPKAEPQPAPPKPEPPAPKPQKETPVEAPKKDLVDQEQIAALAQQKAEDAKKEQERKEKQRQALLDEQEKERKLEEQRKQLAEIRRQREAAERAVNREREKLKQLADLSQRQAQKADDQPEAEHEAERAQTGANGQDNDLAARYAAAIQAAVTQNWNRPDSASPGLLCTLNIVQIPGGDVISVSVASPCNADQSTRNSIEQAVMKAAPLPYRGYENVFQRSVKFNFRYDG